MSLRPSHALVALPLTAVVFTATVPAVSQAATHVAAAKTKNGNFKGKWMLSNSQTFTVTKENARTGKCKGKITSGGYGFNHCKVSGHHVRFHITYGAEYTSYTGTFTKHKLHGYSDAEDGTAQPYTATRHKVK